MGRVATNERIEAGRRERRVLARVSRAAWRLEQAGRIIAHASWLAHEDFARFVCTGTSITEPSVELASIDWAAAIGALDAGELPSSGGRAQNAPPRGQPR
jgi:hypothetical protein